MMSVCLSDILLLARTYCQFQTELLPIIISIFFFISAIDKVFIRKCNSQDISDALFEKSHGDQEQLHPLVQDENSFTPDKKEPQSKAVWGKIYRGRPSSCVCWSAFPLCSVLCGSMPWLTCTRSRTIYPRVCARQGSGILLHSWCYSSLSPAVALFMPCYSCAICVRKTSSKVHRNPFKMDKVDTQQVHRNPSKMDKVHTLLIYGATITMAVTFAIAVATWVVFTKQYSR